MENRSNKQKNINIISYHKFIFILLNKSHLVSSILNWIELVSKLREVEIVKLSWTFHDIPRITRSERSMLAMLD